LLVGSRSAELVTGPSPDTGSSKTKTETKGTAGAANGDVSGSPSAATKEQKAGSQVNVNVTTEQRTEIRNVIIENKVEPVRPTFSISVGTAVPRTVRLHKLPARVIQIVPQYRDYEYIVLADERIIIITLRLMRSSTFSRSDHRRCHSSCWSPLAANSLTGCLCAEPRKISPGKRDMQCRFARR